ncbi:hypothetical protein [Microseira wollei]|nr:hypothetical protein [Microseira wollei]
MATILIIQYFYDGYFVKKISMAKLLNQDLRTTRKETRFRPRSLVPFPQDFSDRPLFLGVSTVNLPVLMV